MRRIRSACVVGARGAFGQIICEKLLAAGISVIATDLKRAGSSTSYGSFIRGDFEKLVTTQEDRLGGCELLIFCTPEELVVRCLPAALRLTGLRICSDICSVKSRIESTVRKLSSMQQRSVPYISIHPMFGPTRDFSGYNLCVVPFQRGRSVYAAAFVNLLKTWSARLIRLSVREHDSLTSWNQAALHVSLLAYAYAVTRSNVPLRRMLRTGTPIQKVFLSLASRTAAIGNLDTNWQIQHANPFARSAREQLLERMNDLIRTISKGDKAKFASELRKISRSLGENDFGLKKFSGLVLAQARNSKKPW